MISSPMGLQRSRGVIAAESIWSNAAASEMWLLQRSRGVIAAERRQVAHGLRASWLLQRSRGVIAAERANILCSAVSSTCFNGAAA